VFALNLDAIPIEGPPPLRRIAQGLSEPMGLTISGGRIFVTEKNEANELIGEDGYGFFETSPFAPPARPVPLDHPASPSGAASPWP